MNADRGEAIAWRSLSHKMTCYHMPDEKTLKILILHFLPTLQFTFCTWSTFCIRSAVCSLRSAVCILGKISAQPHTTLCIQFLDRGNNDKKQYIVVGKTDLFYNGMRLCGNVLPHFVLTGIRSTNTVKIPVCELILHFRFLLHKYSFLL